MDSYYLYIARCRDSSLYIGVSNDLSKRIKRHNEGYGAKWVQQHGEACVVYTESFDNYLEAHRRELQIKKWSGVKKERLIKGLKP